MSWCSSVFCLSCARCYVQSLISITIRSLQRKPPVPASSHLPNFTLCEHHKDGTDDTTRDSFSGLVAGENILIICGTQCLDRLHVPMCCALFSWLICPSFILGLRLAFVFLVKSNSKLMLFISLGRVGRLEYSVVVLLFVASGFLFIGKLPASFDT